MHKVVYAYMLVHNLLFISYRSSYIESKLQLYCVLQWGSEIRTNPDFGWSILTRTGCPNIEHPKSGLFCPVFECFTSLDHFINKRVITNIFFIIKRSRLVCINLRWINPLTFEIRTHLSGFRMVDRVDPA
jgi:hypothetical protein